MKILCILGHFQHAGDWKLVQALRDAGFDVTEREQCINNSGPNVVTLADILAADVIYVYSHGLDSLLTLTKGFVIPIPCWLIVVTLGVPNGAGVGGWDLYVPHEILQVVDWQATPDVSVPASVPVKPLDGIVANEVWYEWGDTKGEAAILSKTPRVNVNLRPLVTNPLDLVGNHCNLPNHPDLIAAQVRVHKELTAGVMTPASSLS